MANLTCRPVSGPLFTFPSQTFSALLPFIIFTPLPPIFHHSCVLLLFSWCVLIHLVSPSRVDGGEAREREGSEQKSFTAWLRFIYQHQVFSARHLKSQLRNLSPGPANKERSSTFPVHTAFSFHDRYLSRSDCMGLFFPFKGDGI